MQGHLTVTEGHGYPLVSYTQVEPFTGFNISWVKFSQVKTCLFVFCWYIYKSVRNSWAFFFRSLHGTH